MMKRRGTVLVLLSLALGLSAAWGANEWVQGRLSEDGGDADVARVVAAALSIPYGTKIEARHVRLIDLPPDGVPDAAVMRLENAVGKVATIDIERGELLLASRLADHTGGSTLAALVKESMRAITVRVDDVVGVAGFLLPGNYVDVVASRLDRQTRRATTETVLRNLKVLAVDQTASTDGNEPVIVRAVTLEVTPAESEVLIKAKEEGTIQLTLRNPNEVYVAEAPEPKKAAPVPAPRRVFAPTSTEVQIIRGTRVDKTKINI
jgi:pilus assembly protein CpaB